MSVYRTTPRTPSRQKGAAILVITILLLLVATIGTLMVGRTGVTEQKIVGTDVRSKEVYSAANGGLETAVSWFEEYYEDLNWSDCGDTLCAGIPDDHPDQPSLNAELGADDYSGSIQYTLRSEDLDARPLMVMVSSTANADNDSHINKTVSVDVMLGTKSIFSPTSQAGDPSGFNGPPIMVDTCMEGITGGPDVYPNGGIAVGTTRGLDPDLDGNEDETLEECLDEGHLNLNGGSERALAPPQPLWNAVFGANTTEADLRQVESREPERVYIVDASYPNYSEQPSWNGNTWHDDLGSEENPVILYFDSSVNCPKINGNVTIYGIVYFEESADCTQEGWGGATIYGTVAVEGDMTGLNANAEAHGRALDFGGGEGDDDDDSIYIPPSQTVLFSEIPGAWRDF